MIDGRSVLAIVPARGGSKGIPEKNIYPFGGKPLIGWTIEAARKSKYIDRTILSSDSEKIIAVARNYGCEVPFVRPPELSSDTSASAGVVLHALETINTNQIVVLLQPTSPLRTAEDIDATLELYSKTKARTATTITRARQSPFHMFFQDAESAESDPKRGFKRILGTNESVRRQDQKPAFILNGAVFIVDGTHFVDSPHFVTDETVFHTMPEERSVDIDTLLDLKYAELLINWQETTP